MKEINKEQFVEVEEIKNENSDIAAVTDIWMDFTPPANVDGIFKYRKLTDDNMLEIYLDGRNKSGDIGSILIGILASKYRPIRTQIITGFIIYKSLVDGASRLQIQYLNIGDDGEVKVLGGVGQEVIKNFVFHGFVDL